MSTCLCLPQLRERSEQRPGNFGIACLGVVATLNIQHLVYRSSDVAWDAVTSHLFVLRHPAALPSIRLQVARTLDDILAIVPRHLAAAPSDLQATVQRRVLDVLAQQIMLGGLASGASMELRRLGLETLHQILQASGYTLLVGWETIFIGARQPALSDTASQTALSSPGLGDPTTRLPEGEGLFGANQDRFSMHDAYVRCSRRSFTRAPPSLHQYAWAVWSAGGHEYRPDHGGESFMGRLGRDTDEATRSEP